MRVCPCCEEVERYCECSREDIQYAKQSIRNRRKLKKVRKKQQIARKIKGDDYADSRSN